MIQTCLYLIAPCEMQLADMVLKGTIPVLDETYDLTDPASTGMTVVTGVLGVAMMLGIFAGGRALWNRLSMQTDAVGQIEVL